MTSTRVRPAGPADADVLAQLLADFNTEFDEPSPLVDEFAGRLRRLLGQPLFESLLAEEDGEVIGFAIVTLRDTHYSDAPIAVLDELYVRPARRGRGAGAVLLAAVESGLLARGVEGLSIPVDAPDTGARRFYERAGYSCLGEVTGAEMLTYERSFETGA